MNTRRAALKGADGLLVMLLAALLAPLLARLLAGATASRDLGPPSGVHPSIRALPRRVRD